MLPENPIYRRPPHADNPLYDSRGDTVTPTPEMMLAEIEEGPLAAAVAADWAAGNDAAVCAIFYDPTLRSSIFPMTVGDFANWLAGAGLLRAISDSRTHADPVVSSLSLLLMYKIQGDPSRIIDIRDESTQGMFGAFVAASIATETHVTAFTAACTRPCSRAEELGWSITHLTIAAARSIQ